MTKLLQQRSDSKLHRSTSIADVLGYFGFCVKILAWTVVKLRLNQHWSHFKYKHSRSSNLTRIVKFVAI